MFRKYSLIWLKQCNNRRRLTHIIIKLLYSLIHYNSALQHTPTIWLAGTLIEALDICASTIIYTTCPSTHTGWNKNKLQNCRHVLRFATTLPFGDTVLSWAWNTQCVTGKGSAFNLFSTSWWSYEDRMASTIWTGRPCRPTCEIRLLFVALLVQLAPAFSISISATLLFRDLS